MIILPAIDLMGGKCVRLLQGRKKEVTYYEKDPLSLAKQYREEGAEMLHVVDLDGAFTGQMKNIGIVKRLAKEFVVQVGGGVRAEAALRELLDAGATKVILGSMLLKNPELAEALKKKYADRVIGAFDFSGQALVYEGWVKSSPADFGSLASGFDEIIITDTTRDGTLTGPNLELLRSVQNRCAAKIIVAGGVGKMADIRALKDAGAYGAILGKSLLDGKIALKEAIACSQKE